MNQSIDGYQISINRWSNYQIIRIVYSSSDIWVKAGVLRVLFATYVVRLRARAFVDPFALPLCLPPFWFAVVALPRWFAARLRCGLRHVPVCGLSCVCRFSLMGSCALMPPCVRSIIPSAARARMVFTLAIPTIRVLCSYAAYRFLRTCLRFCSLVYARYRRTRYLHAFAGQFTRTAHLPGWLLHARCARALVTACAPACARTRLLLRFRELWVYGSVYACLRMRFHLPTSVRHYYRRCLRCRAIA